MDDFTFMSTAQRREALLALAKTPDAGLGALGLEPADAPLFVMSTGDELTAGDHVHCLMAAASSLGMTVMEPTLVQGQGDAPDTYEAWGDMGGSPTRLASAATQAEASEILRANLEMLAGHMAMPLAVWLEVERSDPFSQSSTKARRSAQWAQLAEVSLSGKVLGDGWVNWTVRIPTEVTKVRQKQARELLMNPDSLRLVKRGKATISYVLQAVQLDGNLYANFHDLSQAARAGIDVSQVRPWPYFGANTFVVKREYQRALRAAGWRMLWRGEESPGKRRSRRAVGSTWVRAAPVPLSGRADVVSFA